jgi:Flp pilus assembly protein TadD
MARGDNQGALNMLMAHRPEFLVNKDYYTLLASLHYKVGNFQRSVYWYRQLLSIDHQNARLWLGLAVSLDSLNKADDALQAFSYVRLYASNQPIIKHYINERQLALADY